MNVFRFSRHALATTFAGTLLTNCVAPAPIAPSGTSPDIQKSTSGSRYKVSKHLLYVALDDVEPPYDQVNIYDAKEDDPPVLAAITDGVSEPGDVCIDAHGTLYVTNQGSGAGWISVYALGSLRPSRKITDGLDGPAFCAIDHHGNLWVTNLFVPDVVEYHKGSSVPIATITNGITYPVGIAIDHAGNIYVANHDVYSTTNVEVYPSGAKSPSRTITDGVLWPVGIAVDAAATLYVTNAIPGNVEEYRAGRSRPYREITDDMNGPTAVTFAKNGWAYITNTGVVTQSGPAPVILEFPPGSLKPSGNEISSGLDQPLGTAFYPPLLP